MSDQEEIEAGANLKSNPNDSNEDFDVSKDNPAHDSEVDSETGKKQLKDVFGEEDDGEEDDESKQKSSKLVESGSESDNEGEHRKSKHKKSRSSREGENTGKKRRIRSTSDNEDPESSKRSKSKEKFSDSDDEESQIQAGQVVDTETGEVVKSSSKRKLSRKEQEDLMRREKEQIRKFVEKLRNAAFDDKDAYQRGQMAVGKMGLLDQLVAELSNKNKMEAYLECRVLKALKMWLEPLDPARQLASLPNQTLLTTVLEVLDRVPVDREPRPAGPGEEAMSPLDLIAESQVGHAVAYLKFAFRKDRTSRVYRLADKIKEKWYRVIFDKADDLRKDKDEPARVEHIPRPNREWERAPESVNDKGGKAGKGEYGFRYGASFPRPMLMAFAKRPESKVKVEEAVERAKERRSDYRDRLAKVSREAKRRTAEGASKAAVPEVNRIIVGGVASKVASMGWADSARSNKPH